MLKDLAILFYTVLYLFIYANSFFFLWYVLLLLYLRVHWKLKKILVCGLCKT